MMDHQFKLAAAILCLISLISPLTSGAGGALQRRDENVDFSKMPQCSWSVCSPLLNSLLDCGQGVARDCFCKKTNPLVCAWTVSWDCWNRTEDWYDTQCPGKPLVDLNKIPSCARSCFDEANVCKEQTYNCVCSQPRPDCSSKKTTCFSTEAGSYDAWYRETCSSNSTSAPGSSTRGSASESPSAPGSPSGGSTSPTSPPSSKGLSGGAIAGVAIGAVAGTSLLAGIFLYFFCRRRGPAPSAPQTVAYSDPKVGHDFVPNVVQPAPLVEAPGDYR